MTDGHEANVSGISLREQAGEMVWTDKRIVRERDRKTVEVERRQEQETMVKCSKQVPPGNDVRTKNAEKTASARCLQVLAVRRRRTDSKPTLCTEGAGHRRPHDPTLKGHGEGRCEVHTL
jgi:hypothetical protein